jgi:hypothetical protein
MCASRVPGLIIASTSSIEFSKAPASPFFLAKSQKLHESTQTLVGFT